MDFYHSSAVVFMDSWGIAKSVKARDFDSRIRWFESNYPSQFMPFFGGLRGADKGSLAQLVEQSAVNRSVVGSSPTQGAMLIFWGNLGYSQVGQGTGL